MTSYKIFNDPVYGFIRIPKGILLYLIDHPYVQRLRRIKQLGLTSYVYPGAVHSRFHHAMGALHLMIMALDTLQAKGVEITPAEREGAQIAILLHDIGHGPFSHALERKIIPLDHEEISLEIMKLLNEEFDGQLDLAIAIFTDQYPKRFLHQLVSGQLDMDRMDYLKRDSFFTGVPEGTIGHDRIIMMLNVVDDQLVVEEKGIYSIEKFLIARRLMYWQVYLHKTVISAEQMMIAAWSRIIEINNTIASTPTITMRWFLASDTHQSNDKRAMIKRFLQIDDVDVMYLIKSMASSQDQIAYTLCNGIINRELFKIILKNTPISCDLIRDLRQKLRKSGSFSDDTIKMLILQGSEQNQVYSEADQTINILTKSGHVRRLSEIIDISMQTKITRKHFLCYPCN